MMRIKTRYVVRNARGEELVVPSLEDLRALYAQGFLEDGDAVRQERAAEWVPVGEFAPFHGLRAARTESPARVGAVVTALLLLALAVGIMLAH